MCMRWWCPLNQTKHKHKFLFPMASHLVSQIIPFAHFFRCRSLFAYYLLMAISKYLSAKQAIKICVLCCTHVQIWLDLFCVKWYYSNISYFLLFSPPPPQRRPDQSRFNKNTYIIIIITWKSDDENEKKSLHIFSSALNFRHEECSWLIFFLEKNEGRIF